MTQSLPSPRYYAAVAVSQVRLDGLLAYLRGMLLEVETDWPDEPTAVHLCALHPEVVRTPASAILHTLDDHTELPNCDVCHEGSASEVREVQLIIPADAPLLCRTRQGDVGYVAGLMIVSPFAYVCGACAEECPVEGSAA